MYKKSSQFHNRNQGWNKTKAPLNNTELPEGAGGIGFDVKYVRTKRRVKRRINDK